MELVWSLQTSLYQLMVVFQLFCAPISGPNFDTRRRSVYKSETVAISAAKLYIEQPDFCSPFYIKKAHQRAQS